ncbi:MAG: hypothetical protein VX964_05675 [Verrucomicrobiota bacterium]|jgi:hypothetical protein|nr:hypothetical protein [Verrucomicrobiota bacterium]MEC8189620.1 hypothetical protein [Verrucomicrobiota bacterium]|tara:strand:+ start:948 stop:1232 length:285 start_codon:yes stop_codon:yes gene_type:complete
MNIYAILKGVGNGSLSVATDGAKAIGKLASAVSQSYKKGYEEAQAAAPIQDLDRAKENLRQSHTELSDEEFEKTWAEFVQRYDSITEFVQKQTL